VTHGVHQVVGPWEASLVATPVLACETPPASSSGVRTASAVPRVTRRRSAARGWCFAMRSTRVFLRQNALTGALTHELEHVRRSDGRQTQCHISAARSKPV
jgi:hypothetical protein